MNYQHPQLPLDIRLNKNCTFDNFVAGENMPLLSLLTNIWAQTDNYFYLWGRSGSGCSHLLQAICHASGVEGQSSMYLPLSELAGHGPSLLEGLETIDMLCIDEIGSVVGDSAWEEALFHCYNRGRESGTRLVIAAPSAPSALGLSLADLESRLTAGAVFQVKSLNDAGQTQMLQMRASHSGLNLSLEVARFIQHRSDRDTKILGQVMDRLDRHSLSAQRKLTIPFVKEAMGW